MSNKKTKRDIDKEKMFNKIMPSAAASRDDDADAPRPLYPRPPIVDTLSDGSNPDFKPVATVPAAPPSAPAAAPSAVPDIMPNTTPAAIPSAIPEAVPSVMPNTTPAAIPNAIPEAVPSVAPIAAIPPIPAVTPVAPITPAALPPATAAEPDDSERSQELARKVEEIIPELPEPQTPHFAQQYQQTASFAELFASKTGQHIEPHIEPHNDPHGEIHENTHSENVTVTDVAPTTAENAKETVLINIKERMVMKKLEKSLEKFNCCKCYFCRQDVVAAALNLLPPKYVVVVREDIDSLIKKENDQDVTAALIKAILQVRNNPRH